jgi:putative nucleotidyltransferase with HDIG domain
MKTVQDVLVAILSTSDTLGCEVSVVGGYVRDLLLGRPFKKDIDCVVVGSGLVFARAFDTQVEKVGRLIEFPDFDTARYLIPLSETETLELEFAGARSEVYDPNSRKPVVMGATLETDMRRRDFTVNAMAIPVSALAKKKMPSLATIKKSVFDPLGGQKDLAEKILKTPLDPDATFSDDPLRMLRAIRFAAQLDFTIDGATLEAIHRNRKRLSIISAERIQEELFKLLATKTPSIGLFLLFQTHLLDVFLPEVSSLDGVEDVYGHQHKNNLIHSFKVVDNIAERSDKVWLRLAGLLHDIGKPGTKKFVEKIGWTFHGHEHLGKKMLYAIAKRLKFSKDLTEYLAKLIRWHLQPIGLMDDGITDSAVRRLIVTMGPEINDLLILGRGDITTGNPHKKEKRLKNYDYLETRVAEVIERDKLMAFQSPLRGDEIMSLCGLKPGPTVGKIKTAIEEAILDGIIPNDYEPAKAYFEQIKDTYLAKAENWEKAV